MIGAGVAVTLGAAYMAGGMMRTANEYAQASRLAVHAQGRFTDGALKTAAAGMDPSVLTIAARHDVGQSSVELDRRNTVLATRLEQTAQTQPQLVKASFAVTAPVGQPLLAPAAPYIASGARELECLTQAVYYEARGETPKGQAAIAQVVLNRARSPNFPNSICGVVFQGAKGRGCQFSFACNGAMRGRRETAAWNRAQKVAARALAGFVVAEVGTATHFHTTSVNPKWGPSLLRIGQIGLHVFYKPTRAPKGYGYRVAKAESVEQPERVYKRLPPEERARFTSAPAQAKAEPMRLDDFITPPQAKADDAAAHAQEAVAAGA